MPGDTFRPLGAHRRTLLAGDDRPDARCFADEVGIDFPSVTGAVDRIRRGFLAEERPACWTTTLRLSDTEARRGATLPLEVPVRRACEPCGGRGESWTERCAECQGTGVEVVHHALQVRVPAGVVDGDRLHFTLTPGRQTATRVELQVLVADEL
jgi:hypothetical protein